MKHPDYLPAVVRIGGQRLTAEYKLYPARKAPHVGADSPRHMEPGSPARIEVLRLMMGRVALDYDVDKYAAAAYQIRKQGSGTYQLFAAKEGGNG
jgi:hypothetical protein